MAANEGTTTSSSSSSGGTGGDSPADNEVLVTGAVDWDNIGNKTPDAKSALTSPHVLRALSGRKIVGLSTGSAACHFFFLSADGDVYALGRNKTGQLGLGNLATQTVPQLVKGLQGHRIVQVASGKGHTLFLSDDGKVFAAGDNKCGQCGQSSLSTTYTSPVPVPTKYKIQSVSCGVDFSVLLTRDTGLVLTFGNAQYGQLGHGSDGQTLEKANRVTFGSVTEPREVRALAGKKIVEVVAGNNHCLARSDQGHVFAWGFAGYGRLGLRDQKDKFLPTEVPEFSGKQVGMRSAHIYAGADVSFSVAANNQTYCFGKYKQTGDAYMYPKPVQDLMGWHVREIACGNMSVVVLADQSVIVWKGSVGELGLGEQKSSANPKKNDHLEGFPVSKVTCGYATTFWIARPPAGHKLPDYDVGPIASMDATPSASSNSASASTSATAADVPAETKAADDADDEVTGEPVVPGTNKRGRPKGTKAAAAPKKSKK